MAMCAFVDGLGPHRVLGADHEADVCWSAPVDGLSLGIEVPQSPFRIVVVEDREGPLQVSTPTGNGGLRLRYNPGTLWDSDARVTVHLKNVSERTIYWSRLFTVWSVSLTSADFDVPEPLGARHPAPPWDDPIPLEPGEVHSMTVPVGGFANVWPRLRGGRYEVSVEYAPAPMLRFAQGGEGNWSHPYDVPGFWVGPGRTPAVQIQVEAERGFSFEFNFADGPQGWSHGFSDYPIGEEDLHELAADYRPLPAGLDEKMSALFIAGNNRSRDLFMYYRRKVNGLEPSRAYEVSFTLDLASNAPRGCMGFGGAPGESVYVKLGASPDEPKPIKKQGWYRLSVDKGEQDEGGRFAVVIGDASTYHTDCSGNGPYRIGARGASLVVSASEAGELWLFFGTDSDFEGTTSLYYTWLMVHLTPQ